MLPPDAAENIGPLTVMLFLNRKYKRAASISKIILTLDDIVFIDTQVSKKVRPTDRERKTSEWMNLGQSSNLFWKCCVQN